MPNGIKIANGDQRAWTLMHTIVAGMGAIISILLIAGISSINGKIETGDTLINTQLYEIKKQHADMGEKYLSLAREVSVIKANQDARLQKELIEYQNKLKNPK